MQPPVVRKQIKEFIRRRGEPTGIRDMEVALKLPYGNIIQACTRAVVAGDLVKLGPGTFGLPGVAYGSKSLSTGHRPVSRTIVVPRKKTSNLASWVERATKTDGHD